MTARSFATTGVLVVASAFFAYDIVTDVAKGHEGVLHLTVEGLVFLATSTVMLLELLRVLRMRRQLRALQDRLSRVAQDVHERLEEQFRCWGLSGSQREVALLLIKGLSMAEIAQARGVKEKTVRQQAAEVYARSGCAGRHELAAYFMDELLTATGSGDGAADGRSRAAV